MTAPLDPHPDDPCGVVTWEGERFRDLDHDGVVAPYEDWRLDPAVRAADLVARLTVAEKVGLMLHGTLPSRHPQLSAVGVGDAYDTAAVARLVDGDGLHAFITRLAVAPAELARQNNAVQAVAAAGRLGIPVVVSTDPRHHFSAVTGAGVDATGVSQWPGPLGFGAIGDVDLARRFGAAVAADYRAMGIHLALSPQADLAREPRWPRADGTFGSDHRLVSALAGAMIEGLQGGPHGPTPTGVAAVVKHWVGYGAARDGFDGHNHYGRFSAFPAGDLDDHVAAFADALRLGVAGVMPTYNILEGVELDGVPLEPVGAGFSHQLLTGLLRGRHGFAGVVLSDWGITRDATEACLTGEPPHTPADIAMPWGVEHLTRPERVAKGVLAGLDQIGGENDPGPLLDAVRLGLVSEARLDESVHRILVQSFRLGLFEQPFVDADAAAAVVARPEVRAEAAAAQRRSVTFLAAAAPAPARPTPLVPTDVVVVHGMAPDALTAAGLQVTDDPAAATVALVRLRTPHRVLHPTFFFGGRQHEGDLHFDDDDPDLLALQGLARSLPTVVVVNLDRPAVLTAVRPHATVLAAEYGLDDDALVAVLLAPPLAAGRLPFALPADMTFADAPGRPWVPSFPAGHGGWPPA